MNYIETPEMTDEVLETLKIMIGMYESYSKDIGVSRKEAESRLCWFMGNTSFKKRGHTSGNGILYSRVRRLYNELM